MGISKEIPTFMKRILNDKPKYYNKMRKKMDDYYNNDVHKVPSQEDLDYCFGGVEYSKQKEDARYLANLMETFYKDYEIIFKLGEMCSNKFDEDTIKKIKKIVITIKGVS